MKIQQKRRQLKLDVCFQFQDLGEDFVALVWSFRLGAPWIRCFSGSLYSLSWEVGSAKHKVTPVVPSGMNSSARWQVEEKAQTQHKSYLPESRVSRKQWESCCSWERFLEPESWIMNYWLNSSAVHSDQANKTHCHEEWWTAVCMHLKISMQSFPPVRTAMNTRNLCWSPTLNYHAESLKERFMEQKESITDEELFAWEKTSYIYVGLDI